MKFLKLLLFIPICYTLTSCFKDEPLNAECDIEQAYVHLDNPTEIFYSLTDTLINVLSNENTVTFYIKEGADLTSLSPMFIITEGATIIPESGSTHDFSNGNSVEYDVYSQDGNYHRHYSVRFVEYQSLSEFHFENFYLTDGSNGGQYYEWTDLYPDGTEANNWANANPAFNLTMGSASPDEYPTTTTPYGYEGNGVILVTRSTGAFGELFGRRMAAGNLFLGYFDLTVALLDQMQATNFGVPFNRKPKSLIFHYKYQEGETYADEKGNPLDEHDRGNIYAVLYINHDENGDVFYLHGDDVKTSPNIVAKAEYIDESGEAGLVNASEWQEKEVDFEYYDEIDEELLANHGYNIAVVCTSSRYGNEFKGAIGSTLYADEITIVCEDNE